MTYSVCRGSPTVSHLLFADDSFLFFRASESESTIVKNVLLQYGVNSTKFSIMFSSNTKQQVRQSTPAILSATAPLNHGSYLCLPSLIGRNKK